MRVFSFLMMIFVVLNLAACETSNVYAPVHDLSQIESIPKKGVYRVQRGDTLYSIAWRYGMDYRRLAKINNIKQPYHIEKGELIYLRSAPSTKKIIAPAPLAAAPQPQIHTVEPVEREPSARVSAWLWPSRGPMLRGFSEMNKGINIGGRRGDAVVATAGGKVVYCGNGLHGYGDLIIIKHNSTFLSAYAHNQQVIVKQGDWVKAGQKIAEKGDSDAKIVMLHFEIRKGGQPVNPLSYLGRR